MTLSSMVVSRDWQEISVLECILGGLQIDVEVESEPARAFTKLSKSKIDALIVDCDLKGSQSFLRHLQENGRHSNTIPLVILGGSRGQNELSEKDAIFSFEKPISVEQAVRTLSAARNLILDGRLRYQRQALEVPISVTYGARRRVQAKLTNLSQGGMGIRFKRGLEMRGPVRVCFQLPKTKQVVKAAGEIAWTDQLGNSGIRFVDMNKRTARDLQLWLAQQYFTE
jgi:CheY-like chemotaxis protein